MHAQLYDGKAQRGALGEQLDTSQRLVHSLREQGTLQEGKYMLLVQELESLRQQQQQQQQQQEQIQSDGDMDSRARQQETPACAARCGECSGAQHSLVRTDGLQLHRCNVRVTMHNLQSMHMCPRYLLISTACNRNCFDINLLSHHLVGATDLMMLCASAQGNHVADQAHAVAAHFAPAGGSRLVPCAATVVVEAAWDALWFGGSHRASMSQKCNAHQRCTCH